MTLPIEWVRQPVRCIHSPHEFHYLTLGSIDKQVTYLSCECLEEEGKTFCAVENQVTGEYNTCYAAMVHVRNLLSKSYTSGARKYGLGPALTNVRGHIPGAVEPSRFKDTQEEHFFVSLVYSFHESANHVRGVKLRPYKQYRPFSYTSRKAFLLEKFIRRQMGPCAPMFHVHPHDTSDEKLSLLMGTTKILTCGLDLETNRRNHQSWTATKHKFHHSNAQSQDCLFCDRTFFNMGSHVIGQGHIKRVAEAVNKARRIMSPAGIRGAYSEQNLHDVSRE